MARASKREIAARGPRHNTRPAPRIARAAVRPSSARRVDKDDAAAETSRTRLTRCMTSAMPLLSFSSVSVDHLTLGSNGEGQP